MSKKILFVCFVLLSAIALTACGGDDDLTSNVTPQNPTEDNNTSGGGQNGDNNGQNDDNNGQDNDNNPSGDFRVINLSEAQKNAVDKNNDFAFNFFRQISEVNGLEGHSFICSPLSATYALGMLNTGGQGKTSEEITAMLGFTDGSKQDVNDLCKLLIEQAPQVDQKATLKLADCVVTRQDVTLADTYQKEVKDYYQGELFSKDFSLPSTLSFINDWCSKHTEGMIPKIIDNLDPNSKLVLMNAIYFKAPWSGKFDEKETRSEEFTKEDGGKLNLAMMHREGAAFYQTNSLYATLGLPYGNGTNWVMYVLLPNEGHTVSEVAKSLTNSSWNQNRPVVSQYGPDVDVKLPKFKIESDISLNGILSSMGAATMFNPSLADFTPMTVGGTPLWVSMVRQKAAIEVAEEGTEASAVTIVGLDTADIGGTDTTEIPKFYATRPFIYIIQEASSKAVFFIGAYFGE